MQISKKSAVKACAFGMLVLIAVLAGMDYCIFQRLYITRAQAEIAAQRAYQEGLSRGMEIAIDNSAEIAALKVLFEKYRLTPGEAEQYARWVLQYAAKHRVPALVLAGMVMQESSCRADAVSSTGAVGLTQVTWRWWGSFLQDLGIAQDEADLFDPETSIEAGAAILAHLIDRYGSIERALEHYSGGAREYVAKVSRRVFAW